MEKNELICEILSLYDRLTELENENKALRETEEVREAFSDVPDISWSAKVVDDSLNALKAKFVDEYFSGDKFSEYFYGYNSAKGIKSGMTFDEWLDHLTSDVFDSDLFCRTMSMNDLKRIFRGQLKEKYEKQIGGNK